MYILLILAIICCALAFYFKKQANKYEEEQKHKQLPSTTQKRPSELLFRLVKKMPDDKGTEYDVNVFNNGHVTYLGDEENATNFRPGFHEFNLDKDELDQLRDLYNKLDIAELEESYDCDTEIKDKKDTIILTFLVGDVGSSYTKDVIANCNYPQELSDLIKFVWSQLKLKIRDDL